MRYVLMVGVVLAMASCGPATHVADASLDGAAGVPADAAVDDAASDAPDAAHEWYPCDGCHPVCMGDEPSCITDPGIGSDCTRCVAGCGNRSVPRDEVVSCNAFNTPVCAAISEQATYCYRMTVD